MPAPSQSSTPSRQIQCGHSVLIPKQFLKCKRILAACENIFFVPLFALSCVFCIAQNLTKALSTFAINWLCRDRNVRAMHPGVLLKDLKVNQLNYFTEDAV
jgi:hypothetical protein